MRLEEQRESENVEDRRGSRGPKMAIGGGIGVLIVALIAYFMGADPRQILDQVGQGGGEGGPPRPLTPEEERAGSAVKKVLATTEDVWTQIFREHGKQYRMPKLVLFSEAVS